MSAIQSRQNPLVRHMKRLGAERSYRYENGEFLCDGLRCLREAAATDMVSAVFAVSELAEFRDLPITLVTPDILEYVSPLKNAQDVVFSCKIPSVAAELDPARQYIVLDGVQDPGNVGTVIRTAAAFDFDGVVLVNDCADAYNPKTVRATMGALFKIDVIQTTNDALEHAVSQGLHLCGAALTPTARDIRTVNLRGASVAVGSEGAGLSGAVLQMCDTTVIIPMSRNVESLNAATAAAVLMWQLKIEN
ncbi:MAG: RNA methyltransferase [Oscillospiraceae bacterium]|jgi:TrmH family RNA methyltransferase|nr:RNA methyltransferase [Oscillospiraceae bacterium]